MSRWQRLIIAKTFVHKRLDQKRWIISYKPSSLAYKRIDVNFIEPYKTYLASICSHGQNDLSVVSIETNKWQNRNNDAISMLTRFKIRCVFLITNKLIHSELIIHFTDLCLNIAGTTYVIARKNKFEMIVHFWSITLR